MFRQSMSILLGLGALTLLTPCVLGSVASPAEKLSWLNDHNQVRCQANAKTMPALIWDQALEQVAQQWVNTHPLSHNAQRSSQYEALTRDSSAVVGENLAAGYTTYLLADAAWAAEKSDNPPGGHYTQMVWANTLRVGCARSNTTAPPYGNYYICDYYPAGNYVGQAAFTPAGGSNPNTDACLNQSRTTFLPTMTFPPGTSGANNGVLVYVNVNSGSGTPTAAQAQAANQPLEGPVYIGDAITIDIPHVNITDSASHYSTPISTATFAVAIGIIIAAVSSINM